MFDSDTNVLPIGGQTDVEYPPTMQLGRENSILKYIVIKCFANETDPIKCIFAAIVCVGADFYLGSSPPLEGDKQNHSPQRYFGHS